MVLNIKLELDTRFLKSSLKIFMFASTLAVNALFGKLELQFNDTMSVSNLYLT